MGATPQAWGPGLIGLMFAMALYGVSIGQFALYVGAFPRDFPRIKLLVFVVFFLDNAHSLSMICAFYHVLVGCRLNDLPECVIYLPASLLLSLCFIYPTTFLVQCFYAHRVWIISNRNRIITCGVCVFALAQLVFGILCTVRLIRTPKYSAVLANKFSPLSALASAFCDAMITISIYYHLRPAWTGAHRRDNYIKKLNLVFVQMGLISLINSSAVAIAYSRQSEGASQLLIAAPGAILSKTYVNSMFGVLNARKMIREDREAQAERAIEIPTIPTIL